MRRKGLLARLVRGEAALARGRVAEAIPFLEEGTRYMAGNPTATYFLASESLAQALESQGRWQEAREVLKTASTAVVFADRGLGHFYLSVRSRLPRVYREFGEEDKARQVEAELLKMLPYADADHAIARELRAAGKLGAAQTPR